MTVERGVNSVCITDETLTVHHPLSHQTGGTKLLRTTIGIMLKQGILKAAPVCMDRGPEGTALAGKNSMTAVLQAVKFACCHGKTSQKSRFAVFLFCGRVGSCHVCPPVRIIHSFLPNHV